jgi:uncharacterized protein YqcC (DUF446 family)
VGENGYNPAEGAVLCPIVGACNIDLVSGSSKAMNAEIAAVLIDLEAQLRQLGLWEEVSPPPGALASTQPFCIDTLSLPQWLQFVFLPKLYSLLEQAMPLPRECGVAPLAEEFFRGSGLNITALIAALEELDRQLSRRN